MRKKVSCGKRSVARCRRAPVSCMETKASSKRKSYCRSRKGRKTKRGKRTRKAATTATAAEAEAPQGGFFGMFK